MKKFAALFLALLLSLSLAAPSASAPGKRNTCPLFRRNQLLLWSRRNPMNPSGQ